VQNSLDQKNFFTNADTAAGVGLVTGGIAAPIANRIAPVGPGRNPNDTLIKLGVKSSRQLDNHSVSEATGAILSAPFR
jgi:hypothetical protein